jgi:methoxymalonate biosynthesis acyl carrier protein
MNAPRLSSIQAALAALFADDLGVEIPSSDTDLLATARLDSLGVVELIMQLERRFGITVELEDLELDNFRTLNSIAAFVAARQDARPHRAAG